MKIRVNVTPGSRRERVSVRAPDVLDMSVREEAERGEANERVRQLVALHYKVAIPAVRLVTGHKSPRKTFSVTIPGMK